MKNDHGPHVRREPEEAALDLVAIGNRGLDARGCRDVDAFELDIEAVSPQPARLIDAGTDEQAVKPGNESVGIPECGQITPGSDERVLDGVLGLLGIPEDEPGGGIEAGDRGACQLGKGVMIAPPSSLHEVSLHHAPQRWRRHSTPLVEYGDAGPAIRSNWFVRGFPTERATMRALPAGPSQVAHAPRLAPEGSPRVKIQEADAKRLLLAQGLPVPAWEVARSPAEARAAAARLLHHTGKVVIKAQVLVGGRGKAGGVRLAASDDEAEHVADAILGMQIKGIPVRKVLVTAAADIVKELYLAAVLDRAARTVLLMGSAEGGVEIEQVAATNPEAIVRVHADPLIGLRDWQARELAFRLGLGRHVKASVAIAKGLVATMLANDADLVEINPLAVVRQGGAGGEELVCLDAKITLDDSGLFRHPELESMRDPDEEDPADAEARRHDISFIHLDGTIGCMVNGAGLAMTTMDLVKRAGGEPANFLDIGGGAKADRVAAAMRLILGDPKVEAILVNIFGGITRGDEVAMGLIEARRQQSRDVPMVVRIVGTNADEAARLLEEAHFETATSLDEAAAKAVAAARGRAA